MKKQITQLEEITIVGLPIRTNNRNEMNPKEAKIGPLFNRYWSESFADKIQGRISPGVTYAVYTQFEQEDQADYTYILGEVVESASIEQMDGLEVYTISPSKYLKLTSEAGPLPDVVIQSWQHIWQMKAEEFGGTRRFSADFEVYDYRASDPKNATVDVFIGLQ